MFDRLDTDNSGELGMDKFQQLLQEVGHLPNKM